MGGDHPPHINNGAEFRQWRLEVDMWALGTGILAAKRAPVCIGRIMDKKAKDTVLRLDKTELVKDTGLKFLLDALATHYKEDITQVTFIAIDQLEKFNRPEKMSMSEYIAEFTLRHNHLKEMLASGEVVYHDGILAYRLMRQANLTEDQRTLIKAGMGQNALSFTNVSEALLRCFGDKTIFQDHGGASSSSRLIQVKTEPPDIMYQRRDYDQEEPSTPSSRSSSRSSSSREYDYEEDVDVYYQGRGNSNNNSYRNGQYQQNSRGNQGTPFGNRGNNRNRNSQQYNRFSSGKRPDRNFGYDNQTKRPRNEGQMGDWRKNPLNKQTGEVMRCVICDSTKHMSSNCQHGTPSSVMLQSVLQDENQPVKVINDDLEYAVTYYAENETSNKALIDTGAVRNCCGANWLGEFLEAIPDERKKLVEDTDSTMTFRFGDGAAVKSVRHVLLPVHLCRKKIMLDTFVVPGDLPLLLSKHGMKDWGVSLDILNDKISIEGISQDLEVTRSGHYVADLMGHEEDEVNLTLFAQDASPKKTATKLHRYFGHPRSTTLLKLVENSKYYSKDLRKEIVSLDDTCEHCIRFRRDPARPRVSVWSPSDVNEVVAMDLKFLDVGHGKKLIMFHAIDLFSRFSLTKIIKDKEAETVLTAFFQTWINVMGRPKKTITDNGGEFVNEILTSACEDMGFELRTTGANAPFSNGMCERHNGIIGDAFLKLHDEMPGANPEVLLSWATNAKNSLANTYGHSPYTLVFGRTPSIPGLDSFEMVTTMNSTTVNKVLADHINCMYQSRVAFMKANNDDKLKRAIMSKVTNIEEEYYTGDQVYFRKHNQKRWCGPATVIGKEGKVVFLRQGGTVIRVHATKCVLRERADKQIVSSSTEKTSVVELVPEERREEEDMVRTRRRRTERRNTITHPGSDTESDSSDDDDRRPIFQPDTEDKTESEDRTPEVLQPPEVLEQRSETNPERISEAENIVTENSEESISSDDVNVTRNSDAPNWKSVQPKANNILDLKKNDLIRYKSPEQTDSDWTVATVHSYAGKVSAVKSKDRNRFNITTQPQGESNSLRLDEFDVEKDIPGTIMYIEDDQPNTCGIFAVNVPKTRFNEPGIQQAMDDEMAAWIKYSVYKEVPDTNQKTVSTRWVVTEKGPGKFKARLVVRGFEEDEETAADSPTGESSSTRIVYALAAANGWIVETIDIKAAFLQSRKLDRVVFVKPPRNLKKVGLIWQLEKPAYGLADSSRNWYNSLVSFFKSIGLTKCSIDQALFYHRDETKLNGLVLLHVDDFLTCGNAKFKKDIIRPLLQKYDISKHISGNFVYIGMTVSQDSEGISVDQFDYASHVKIVQLEKARRLQKDSELTPDERTCYLSLLGKLSWLSHITRPDLKYDVYHFSRKNKSAVVQDLMDLNGVVSKLNEKKRIRFPKMDLQGGVKLVVHTDASFGNLDNKVNSCRGYVVFLSSGDKASILAWASNKIKRVVSSTLESETLALIDGLNHAHALRDILSNLLYGGIVQSALSIVAFVDSKQLHDAIHSSRSVSDHRLRRDIANVKERLELGEVSEVRWVPTTEMLADSLTKKKADSRKLDLVLDSGRMCSS